MRVIVCGGRDYDDYERLCGALDLFHKKHGISLLIEGGAKGADAHAAIWAERNGVPRCTFHPNWEKFGKAAGMIRNRHMLEHGLPDAVIAFPGGVGTAGMVGLARKAGIKLWETG